MKSVTRRWIQTFLLAALAMAAIRGGWIFYQRHKAPAPARPVAHVFVNPDYFVYPPHAYLSDFKSARQLKGSSVWVRDGYRYASFPFDPKTGRTRAIKDPPLLAPIRKITIAEVVREPTAKAGTEIINLIFDDPSASPPLRSVTIGQCEQRGQSCRFYLDEMFFLKDPRELYTHWNDEIWKAIERHEAKEGMTEAQLGFAIGYGRVISDGRGVAGAERVVEFRPPDRPPLLVTFDTRGYAKSIQK